MNSLTAAALKSIDRKDGKIIIACQLTGENKPKKVVRKKFDSENPICAEVCRESCVAFKPLIASMG